MLFSDYTQKSDIVRMADFLFINENPWNDLSGGTEITFKIRHTPEFTSGRVFKEPHNYIIRSESPIAGLAPGQFGVVYDAAKKICLGSGVIA